MIRETDGEGGASEGSPTRAVWYAVPLGRLFFVVLLGGLPSVMHWTHRFWWAYRRSWGYSCFVLEFFKEPEGASYLSLPVTQWLDLPFMGLGATLLISCLKRAAPAGWLLPSRQT